jgi:hypothetical protein
LLDCNRVVRPGQARELTRRLLGEVRGGATVVVPSLWHLEIADALLAAVRRKLITDTQGQTGLNLLSQLRLGVDEETP